MGGCPCCCVCSGKPAIIRLSTRRRGNSLLGDNIRKSLLLCLLGDNSTPRYMAIKTICIRCCVWRGYIFHEASSFSVYPSPPAASRTCDDHSLSAGCVCGLAKKK